MASIATAAVGPNAQPLAPAPVAGAAADVVTVINLDTENTVMLGSSATHLPFPLGPLATQTLQAPVWAAAAAGPVQVGVIPGGGAYSPGALTITGPVTAEITGPVAISDIEGGTVTFTNDTIDIIGTGGYVAPGAYSLLLNDTGGHTVAAGGSYTTAVFDMTTFQSYTIAVKGYCGSQASAGAPLCVPVVVSYYADAAATILIDTERWWMWVASGSGAATPICGSGPLRGGWVTVTVGNPVGSESVDVTEVNLYGAGRSLGGSVWQQTPPASIASGITMLTSAAPLVPLPGDDKILAAESNNALTAGSSTYWLPMPLFAGKVSLYFTTSLALANDFVVATAQGLQNGDVIGGNGTQGVVWNPPSAAGTAYQIEIEAGNAPMYFVIHTASTAPTFTLNAQGH